jgi:hypothetical protein
MRSPLPAQFPERGIPANDVVRAIAAAADPGLTGTAVNVTLAPAHIVPVGAAVMDIDGTRIGLTVIVVATLVTLAELGHEAPLTIVTVTASPFTKVVEVNVLFVWPATCRTTINKTDTIGIIFFIDE